jgi:phospholipase/carboxylesterase
MAATSHRSISRRGALLAAVASSHVGCRSGPDERGAGPSSSGPSAGAIGATGATGAIDSGGLEVATLGPMREDEKGGAAVVLLHGWGASGRDLVPLASAMSRPRTRFFVPAGPLAESGGGRAWWHADARDRPAHAWEAEPPPGYQPSRDVAAARLAVQTLLRSIKRRYAPDVLLLGGFSQGAMLSLDVALAADPPVDRVAVLSGVLLADSLAALRAQRSPRPLVFESHGRRDPVLPFPSGERARDLLTRYGFSVTWRPFEGGHEITPDLVKALAAFFFDRTTPP